MKILLKNASIFDSKSPFHLKKQDVLICDDKIVDLKSKIEDESAKVLKLKNLTISPGWFDSGVSFGEPGYEERETISNGLAVAAKSGFTKILLSPNTHPLTDNHSNVSHLIKKSLNRTTSLHPIGCLSVNAEGLKLSPLYDMKEAGAVAFGDYKKPILSANFLKIALEYSQSFDGLILSHPSNYKIDENGMMHEGKISTKIGMKGMPDISEAIQVSRDIQILEYVGGRLHIPFVSSEKSVDLIRNAKKKKLDITCSVGLPHLLFSDENLEKFDSNYKIFPPLRSKTDQRALKVGLLEGVIDMVSSMHEPINIEFKKLEFDLALPGTIALEACFGVLLNLFPLDKALDFLIRGSERFGLKRSVIEPGSTADLAIFNPDTRSILKDENLHSTSRNCAFINTVLNGKVYGSFNNGVLTLSE
jgi:dihydroorotase